jgi:predicted amidohydrolase YtcJ
MYLKNFLYTCVLFSCLCSCGNENKSSTKPATNTDAIYFGGKILTMEGDTASYVEAVLVKNGKIFFAGTKAEADKLKETQMVEYNLRGATMLPGFVDGHSHFSEIGFQTMCADLLPAPEGTVNDTTTLKNTLAAYIEQSNKDTSSILQKHNIIIGMNYDDTQLKEGAHPTRQMLDRVSIKIPIMIIHQSGHLCVLNTAALEKANIDATTQDPEGGVIRREDKKDKSGFRQPNGVLEEVAFFNALGKLYPPFEPYESNKLFTKGTQKYVEQGFTTVQDGKTNVSNLDKLIAFDNERLLDIDVVAYPDYVGFLDTMPHKLGPLISKTYKPNSRFRVGGIKLTLDGSPQGKTAWFSKPYLNALGKDSIGKDGPYGGYAAFPDSTLQSYLDAAFTKKWQLLAHCNGDAASSQLLRLMKNYKQLSREDHRTTIIHGQFMTKGQVDSAKVMGIFVSSFPMHTFNWGDVHLQALGATRANDLSPTGWFRDRKMKFSIHSDAPVIFPASMPLISTAMNRTTRKHLLLGKEHCLTAYTALQAMTIWPAYQHFEENTKGSIKKDKLADFVILEKNPLDFNLNPLNKRADDPIKNIKILATIKEGKKIYGKIPK